MEKPNARGANNFVVGLFVFTSLLVGTGFIVFMGGSTSIGGEQTVKTVFADVRGLNVGAPVYLSGIQIGRVSGFEFPEKYKDLDPKEGGIVTLLSIYREYAPRLKSDSEASITTMGVLGDKVISVSPGAPTSSVFDVALWLPSRSQKELGDYFAKGGNLVETLNELAGNANLLLKQFNSEERIVAVMKNLEKLSHSLEKTTNALNAPDSTLGKMIRGGEADDLAATLKALRRIAEKVEKGQGTLGALVNDATLHEDMKILLGGAKRSQAVKILLRQAINANDESPEKK